MTTETKSQYTEAQLDEYEQTLRKARYIARRSMPYYSIPLHSMTMKVDERACYPVPIFEEDGKTKIKYEGPSGRPKNTVLQTEKEYFIGTAMVDKAFRASFHPGAIEGWIEDAKAVSSAAPCKTCGKNTHHPLAYISGVLVHEMLHPLRKHHKRAEQFKKYVDNNGVEFPYQRDISNVAMDLELNDNIQEIAKTMSENHFCLPASSCFPEGFKAQIPGMAEDLLYEEYYRLFMENPNKKIKNAPHCGSGADGEEGPCDDGASQEGDKGFDGLSESESQIMERRTAEAINDYASKNPGKLPGGMTKWSNSVVEPAKINWRTELSKLIRYVTNRSVAGTTNPSYHKLNRISNILNHEVILPSSKRPVPEVAVVRDTSGSMGGKPEEEARREINGILKTLKCEVNFVDIDTVAVAKKVRRLSQTNEAVGGGGTNIVVGIDKAMEARRKPNLIVVLTDGYSPWHTEAQRFRNTQVLICLCGDSVSREGMPSWYRVLECRD